MTANPAKPPKKVKEKKQTPEQRLAALRYNHMMYGPTEGEMRRTPPKVDYGAPFLKHPKFLALLAAFRNGGTSKFTVTAGEKTFEITAEDGHIAFNGRTVFYSRSLNRYEDNLLLDKPAAVQFQSSDPLVHLVFAILRSFPELEDPPQLHYMNHLFYLGLDALESLAEAQGPNLLIGSFKHTKVQERPRK